MSFSISILRALAPESGTVNNKLDHLALFFIAASTLFSICLCPGMTRFMVIGIVILLMRAKQTDDLVYARIAVIFPLAMITYAWANQLVVWLTPHTIDGQLLRLDFGMGAALSEWWQRSPVATQLLVVIYDALPVPIALGLAFSKTRKQLIAADLLSSALALPMYLAFPATGPAWIGTLASRNGVPSLHFAWALIAWWYSPKWLRVPTFIFAALTAAATLVLREHYVIDLVAAVPFTFVVVIVSNRFKSLANRAALISQPLPNLPRFPAARQDSEMVLPFALEPQASESERFPSKGLPS